MPKCVRGKRRRRGRKLCCMRYDEFCEDGKESTRIIDIGSMPREEKCTASVSTVTHPEASVSPRRGVHRESVGIRGREVDMGSFTGQCTSSSPSSWSRARRVWRVRKPHGHPHLSLQNTQGTCRHQSSCEPPHPVHHYQSNPLFCSMRAVSRIMGAYLLGSNRLLAGLVELFDGLLVVT